MGAFSCHPVVISKYGHQIIPKLFPQNLVGAFVDTHHHLMVKVKSLEDEIEDKKRHVNLLKQELNDAVRREHGQVHRLFIFSTAQNNYS